VDVMYIVMLLSTLNIKLWSCYNTV